MWYRQGRVVRRIPQGGESWLIPRQMGFRGKLNSNRGGEWRSLPGRVEFREGTSRWRNSQWMNSALGKWAGEDKWGESFGRWGGWALNAEMGGVGRLNSGE